MATAVPPQSFTQPEALDQLMGSRSWRELSAAGQRFIKRILLGEHGIARRHFAVEPLSLVFNWDADQLNQAFRREAPRLAAQALAKALERSEMAADELDALVVCTCTGYVCPGVSSYVAERLGLRQAAMLQDLVGLGCGAAIPALRMCSYFVQANPGSKVACVAVEICSAAFYLDDDPGVLVSACLFADGAAALILSDRQEGGGRWLSHFQTLHRPEFRDALRLENRGGRLRNLLSPSVPELVAETVGTLWKEALGAGRVPQKILSHGGGREVLNRLESALDPMRLDESRKILSLYGNMSSPSALFALEEALLHAPPDQGDWWLTGFGAGFAAHACRVVSGPSASGS